MKVTIEVTDYSEPAKPCIRVHNVWPAGNKVELEVDGKRYRVVADELISAVRRAELNTFGY